MLILGQRKNGMKKKKENDVAKLCPSRSTGPRLWWLFVEVLEFLGFLRFLRSPELSRFRTFFGSLGYSGTLQPLEQFMISEISAIYKVCRIFRISRTSAISESSVICTTSEIFIWFSKIFCDSRHPWDSDFWIIKISVIFKISCLWSV